MTTPREAATARNPVTPSSRPTTTAWALTAISPETHSLVLELSNYGKWSGSVDVKANQTANVSATLAGCSYQFVMDWGERGSGDGDYLDQFGSRGTGELEFLSPRGVAVDRFGDIHVTDAENRRI